MPPRYSSKNPPVIGISGKQYAGKDALADLLAARLPDFRKLPLALAIKQAYVEDKPLTLEELEAHKAEHRPGLIQLGDARRSEDPDYWLKRVVAAPGPKIVSDVRLKHEYDFLKQRGAFLIRLEANRDVRARRGQLVSEQDRTENELDSEKVWDAVITNNETLAALAGQVDTVLPKIREKFRLEVRP